MTQIASNHFFTVGLTLLQPDPAQGDISQWIWWIIGGLVVFFSLVIFIAFLVYGKLWFQAFMSSADVSMKSLVFMGFRKVRPTVIVPAKIMAAQAKLDIGRKTGISTDRLEAHYLAGGDVLRVINAIIAAHR